jgi:hypothetical protein
MGDVRVFTGEQRLDRPSLGRALPARSTSPDPVTPPGLDSSMVSAIAEQLGVLLSTLYTTKTARSVRSPNLPR